MLRKCAIEMIRHLGVRGECNIQYALDPKSQKFRIIEVPPRALRTERKPGLSVLRRRT